MIRVAPLLFPLDPNIRYVAVNQAGTITEMEQRALTDNPPETDRMEELIVRRQIPYRWMLARLGFSPGWRSSSLRAPLKPATP